MDQIKLKTDLRQARAETETAQREKSDFLATISHEIRTPLQAIISLTELLQKSSLSEEQLSQITTVHHAGEMLLRMLGDIIDFSAVESGQLQLTQNDFQLSTLINDMTQLFAPSAKNKQLHFNTFIDPKIPRILKGDLHRLQQVLSNLLANAIKFTSEGSILLRVTTAQGPNPNQPPDDLHSDYHYLQFEVSDTGIGISSEQQQKLFQPFSQANLSISQRFGGSGLGLSIAKRIIQLMSGQISVESSLGQGSTFTVWLPMEKAIEQTAISPPIQPLSLSTHDTHILLADDDPITQQVSVMLLEQLGYSADIAKNGLEALKFYQNRTYDLILMDTQMPVMDGCQATRHIRDLESGSKTPIPIIAFTAHHSEEERQRCLNAGMNDFLSKPIHSHELQCQLHRWSQPTIQPSTPNTIATTPYDLLDDACLKQLEKDLGNKTQKVLNLFLTTLPDYAQKMHQAINDKQRNDLKLLAHTLRGSGTIVGALQVAEQCLQLEKASEKESWTEIQARMPSLTRIMQKTEQTLRSLTHRN